MKHIVELEQGMVLPKESFARLQELVKILAPDDKLAFAGSSTLLKMQLVRMLTSCGQVKYFLSVDEARKWLLL